ncbi:MAG: Maf family protein [Pseudomonadota bacterium]
MTIILASGSAIRSQILTAAGVQFDVSRPDVDETGLIEAHLAAGWPVADLPARLALEKALSIPAADPEAWVIGSDQVLEFEGRIFEKPRDLGEARARLVDMHGATHHLRNAVCVVRGGQVAFQETGLVALKMRAMSETEIDAYLQAAGSDILSSVGAYQVEKLGSRLFERIDGDYFTVLGLNLLPLLGFLKRQGALAF